MCWVETVWVDVEWVVLVRGAIVDGADSVDTVLVVSCCCASALDMVLTSPVGMP